MSRKKNQLNKLNSYLCSLTTDNPQYSKGDKASADKIFESDGRVMNICRPLIHDIGYESAKNVFSEHFANTMAMARRTGTLSDNCY